MVEWRTQRFMELLTHHGGVTNEFVSSESTFEANRHRKRVHAYSTLITGGKGAPHPQLRANAPGPSPVNELNGSKPGPQSSARSSHDCKTGDLLLSSGSGFSIERNRGQRGSNLLDFRTFDCLVFRLLSTRIFIIIIFPIRSFVSVLSFLLHIRSRISESKSCRDDLKRKVFVINTGGWSVKKWRIRIEFVETYTGEQFQWKNAGCSCRSPENPQKPKLTSPLLTLIAQGFSRLLSPSPSLSLSLSFFPSLPLLLVLASPSPTPLFISRSLSPLYSPSPFFQPFRSPASFFKGRFRVLEIQEGERRIEGRVCRILGHENS